MLKLAKLPDRVPVKITIAVSPELHARLVDYAAFYEEDHGVAEPISELVPAMVAGFLELDREFARRRKALVRR